MIMNFSCFLVGSTSIMNSTESTASTEVKYLDVIIDSVISAGTNLTENYCSSFVLRIIDPSVIDNKKFKSILASKKPVRKVVTNDGTVYLIYLRTYIICVLDSSPAVANKQIH